MLYEDRTHVAARTFTSREAAAADVDGRVKAVLPSGFSLVAPVGRVQETAPVSDLFTGPNSGR
jgi:hypothetical protein